MVAFLRLAKTPSDLVDVAGVFDGISSVNFASINSAIFSKFCQRDYCQAFNLIRHFSLF
jgi:hypothetical protein